MPYYSGRKQTIGGIRFKGGERVPSKTIKLFRPRILNQMLACGKLYFSEEEAPQPAKPKLVETKPGGWYVFDNGMRIHGKKALEEFYAKAGA